MCSQRSINTYVLVLLYKINLFEKFFVKVCGKSSNYYLTEHSFANHEARADMTQDSIRYYSSYLFQRQVNQG